MRADEGTEREPGRPGIGRVVARWIGVVLTLLAVVATLWLAATGRLELYVHPRYTVFTVIFAIVGGVLAVGGILSGLRDGHAHGAIDVEDDADGTVDDRPPRRLLTGGRVALVAVAAVALLVLPPATLSAATAQNRSLSSSAAVSTAAAPKLVGGSTSGFTVKDWSSLLRSGGADAVTGKSVDVTGYVLPVAGSTDTVYVARLLVTCCAVDAQPVGIPVHLEGWKKSYPANSWVRITGRFQENPDASDPQPVVVVPDTVKTIPEPAKPYVY
jgi:uncharacterized repeat protein (TIGR03943 family)